MFQVPSFQAGLLQHCNTDGQLRRVIVQVRSPNRTEGKIRNVILLHSPAMSKNPTFMLQKKHVCFGVRVRKIHHFVLSSFRTFRVNEGSLQAFAAFGIPIPLPLGSVT